jgi:hypothetical protein
LASLLNGFEYFALLRWHVSGQIIVGKALKLLKKRVLLWCFDIVDDREKHT